METGGLEVQWVAEPVRYAFHLEDVAIIAANGGGSAIHVSHTEDLLCHGNVRQL